uniref:Uncharacterized protein n=1 Tax=Ciona savignyi TaxID=51511 RepID=H2Y4A8_CIOSA
MENRRTHIEASDVDLALEEAGHCGLYHAWLILLMAVPNILVGAHMGSSVFEAMIPTHYCVTQQADDITTACNITWNPTNDALAVPEDLDGKHSPCHMYYYDNVTDIDCKFWTLDKNSTPTVEPGIRTCDHWIFD